MDCTIVHLYVRNSDLENNAKARIEAAIENEYGFDGKSEDPSLTNYRFVTNKGMELECEVTLQDLRVPYNIMWGPGESFAGGRRAVRYNQDGSKLISTTEYMEHYESDVRLSTLSEMTLFAKKNDIQSVNELIQKFSDYAYDKAFPDMDD